MLLASQIRRDGQTQHRLEVDPLVIKEYAALMVDGVVFPPVRVWFDGTEYWLADGFHRCAAAERARLSHICAEIRFGTVADAQWDSYAANAGHGLRRTLADMRIVVARALQHPRANLLTNVELAKHLSISEATLRRWRKKLSSSCADDGVRIVTRGSTTYTLHTSEIGRSRRGTRIKTRTELHRDLLKMKIQSSPNARRLINIVGNWAFASATAAECLDALERVVAEWTHSSS
jgi:hypothetical protein